MWTTVEWEISGKRSGPGLSILNRRYKWVVVAILVAAILAGLIWLWESRLKDRFVAKRWGVVEPNRIYRSGRISRHLVKRILKKHGIRVVVDLTGRKRGDPDQEAEAKACKALDIERVRYSLKGGGGGDIEHYAAAIARIHKAVQEKEPVLVHCAAGTQRTGGVIAAYRLLVQRKPIDSVFREMQRYGWRPEDDPILPRYLNNNMETLADLLVEQGIIGAVPDPFPVIPEWAMPG